MRTPLVAALSAAGMAFLVVGFALRSWQVVLLALPPVIFLGLGALAPPAAPHLAVVRSVSRDRLQVGGAVEVELVVRNEREGLDLVEILDEIPRGLVLESGTNRAVVGLGHGESFALSYALRATVKGEYRIGPLRARGIDPLGLGAEEAVFLVETRVVVAPVLEDMRRVELTPRRTPAAFGHIASRQPGPGSDFWAVREYVAGDDVRRINWKATARLDRALSNEYVGERSGDVVIVLDARRESFVGTTADNPIEHGVRAVLGIADQVLGSRNRVGLVVEGKLLDRVPLAFGRKQLYRILESLVRVRAGGEWPFASVAWILSRYFSPDALVVLISPLSDPTALDALEALAARGFELVVISPSPLDTERAHASPSEATDLAYRILKAERDNLILRLGRIAQVVDWDPATPLALALRRMRISRRRG
jgi:uncharacterized protein (DUF58 family)